MKNKGFNLRWGVLEVEVKINRSVNRNKHIRALHQDQYIKEEHEKRTRYLDDHML